MAGSENRAVTAGLLQGEKESLVLEKENGKLEGGKAGSQQSPLLLQSEDLVTEKTSLPVLGLCYRQGGPLLSELGSVSVGTNSLLSWINPSGAALGMSRAQGAELGAERAPEPVQCPPAAGSSGVTEQGRAWLWMDTGAAGNLRKGKPGGSIQLLGCSRYLGWPGEQSCPGAICAPSSIPSLSSHCPHSAHKRGDPMNELRA